MTRALRWMLLLPLLGLGSRDLRGQEAFDRDAFLSRKKWYVTFVFSLKNKGEATWKQERGESTVKWDILREAGGTFELDHVGTLRPKGSTLADGERAAGRFISWDASVAQSSVDYTVADRVEQKSVRRGEAGAETYVKGWSKFTGAGSTEIGRFKEFKCDLKNMVFDFVLSDLGYWNHQPRPRTLRLTGHYEDLTPATKVGTDIDYPLAEFGIFGHMPDSVPLEPQLLSRRLELKEGKITFSASVPVQKMPAFPPHPGPVPGQPLPYTRNGSLEGGPPLLLSLDVTISPTPPSKVKLILTPPDDYATEWRPMCSESEKVPGNQFKFKWRIEEEGGAGGPPPRAEKITFALLNTSREPGVCMNRPLQPPFPPDFDLKFPQFDPPIAGRIVPPDGQKLVLDGGPARAGKGSVSIDCFDSGATAVLVAEAQLENGKIIKGIVEPDHEPKMLIPDRDDESVRVARGWRAKFAQGKPDRADDEKLPRGDGQPGDGLSVWQEYRGFWVGGQWEAGDPLIRDLFIVNEIGPLAQPGVDRFAFVTQLRLHDKMEPGDMRPDRIINFNKGSGPHTVDQHGLRLIQGGFREEENGIVRTGSRCESMPNTDYPGPPKNTDYITILPAMLGRVFAVGQTRPDECYEISFRDVTIAHELCHGIGIRHHGDNDVGVQEWTYQRGPDGLLDVYIGGRKVRVLEETGGSVQIVSMFNFRKPGASMPVYTGTLKGEHSGDDGCLMRYVIAQAYVSKSNPDVLYYHKGVGEVWGHRLCVSPSGTGVNATTHPPQPRYFRADDNRGDCEHRFVISDLWEKKP